MCVCLCMIWMMIESVDADLAPAPLFIQPYIIIVSEDEQCRKGGDTLERYDTPTQVSLVCMADK